MFTFGPLDMNLGALNGKNLLFVYIVNIVT